MENSFIITFVGDDRPGLVEKLSVIIERNDGNWLESRLSQLGGKFAGLILVTLASGDGSALQAELKSLADSGISVRVTGTGEIAIPETGRDIHLTVLGPDRPGIVREISHALAERQINVVEMDTQVDSAAMSAEMIFRARIDARIPESADIGDLADSLDEIANQMTLEIDLE